MTRNEFESLQVGGKVRIGGVVSCMAIRPRYKVWQQEMAGKAEYAKYESIKDAEQHNGYGSYALRKFHLAGESEVIKDGCRYVFAHN